MALFPRAEPDSVDFRDSVESPDLVDSGMSLDMSSAVVCGFIKLEVGEYEFLIETRYEVPCSLSPHLREGMIKTLAVTRC